MSIPVLSFQFSWKPLWVSKDGATLPYQSIAQQQQYIATNQSTSKSVSSQVNNVSLDAKKTESPTSPSAPKFGGGVNPQTTRCKYPLEATFLVTCGNAATNTNYGSTGPLLPPDSREGSLRPGVLPPRFMEGGGMEVPTVLGGGGSEESPTAFSPMHHIPSNSSFLQPVAASTSVPHFSPSVRQPPAVTTAEGWATISNSVTVGGGGPPSIASTTPTAAATAYYSPPPIAEDPYSIIHWSDLTVPAVQAPTLKSGQRSLYSDPPPRQQDETVSCLRLLPPLSYASSQIAGGAVANNKTKLMAGFGRQGRWGVTFKPILPHQALGSTTATTTQLAGTTNSMYPSTPASTLVPVGAAFWGGDGPLPENPALSPSRSPVSMGRHQGGRDGEGAAAAVAADLMAKHHHNITGNNVLLSFLPRQAIMLPPTVDKVVDPEVGSPKVAAQQGDEEEDEGNAFGSSRTPPEIPLHLPRRSSKSPSHGGGMQYKEIGGGGGGGGKVHQRRRSVTVGGPGARMRRPSITTTTTTVSPTNGDPSRKNSSSVGFLAASLKGGGAPVPLSPGGGLSRLGLAAKRLEAPTVKNVPRMLSCFEDVVPVDVVKAGYGSAPRPSTTLFPTGGGSLATTGAASRRPSVSIARKLPDDARIAKGACGSVLEYRLAATAEELNLETGRGPTVAKALKPETSLCFVAPPEVSATKQGSRPRGRASQSRGASGRASTQSATRRSSSKPSHSPSRHQPPLGDPLLGPLASLQHLRGDPLQVFWAQRYGVTAVQYGVALAKALAAAIPKTIPDDLKTSCYLVGDDCGIAIVSADEALIVHAVSEIPTNQYTYPLGVNGDHRVVLLKPGDYGAGPDGVLRCGTLVFPERIDKILEKSIAEARGVSPGGSSGVLVRSAAHYRVSQQPGDEPESDLSKSRNSMRISTFEKKVNTNEEECAVEAALVAKPVGEPSLPSVRESSPTLPSEPLYGSCLWEVVLGREEPTVSAVVAQTKLEMMSKDGLQQRSSSSGGGKKNYLLNELGSGEEGDVDRMMAMRGEGMPEEEVDGGGLTAEEQSIKESLEKASAHVAQWVGYDAVYQFPRPPYTHRWIPPNEKTSNNGAPRGGGRSRR